MRGSLPGILLTMLMSFLHELAAHKDLAFMSASLQRIERAYICLHDMVSAAVLLCKAPSSALRQARGLLNGQYGTLLKPHRLMRCNAKLPQLPYPPRLLAEASAPLRRWRRPSSAGIQRGPRAAR